MMVEDCVYATSQMEQMLYGDVLRWIPIHLFKDSESTFESVVSSKLEDTAINEVKAHGQEARMSNIRNRMNLGVSANYDPTV